MLRVLTLSTLFPHVTRPNFGVFVEQQTLGLAAHPGVDLRVVAPIGLPPWPLAMHPRYRSFYAVPEEERWRGLPVLRPRFAIVPGTGGRFHAGGLARRLRPLLTALRQDFPFDVIDAEFFFPDGPAAVALGAHFGVPVSIKARGADIHHWGAGPTARQVARAGRHAGGLLAVSAAMKADMVALGLPERAIRVHYTGVDLGRFALADRADAKRALGVAGPLVVSLGALIERKGHQLVVEAVAGLPGVSLLIVGEGPYRPALEAQIANRGLAGRVRLAGAVAHGDMPALLAAAEVMALASASEGLANAWVEALACGVPIVITPVGGAAEVVTRRDYGLIAKRTPGAFRAAIADILANPPAASAVRQGAMRFTWGANTAALADHLREIALKSPQTPG